MSDTRVDPPVNRQNPASQASSRPPTPSDTQVEDASPRSDLLQSIQLDTGQGKTIIADGVVAKIASAAAREVEGVHDLIAMGAGAAIAGFAGRLSRSDQRTSGVSVEVGQREAAVDLNMTVDYGVSIPQVAEAVRQNIRERVRAMTGLTVKEVNVNAADLYFPGEETTQQPRVQ